MWLLYAVGSALFAGLTSILAKCGIRKTDSTVATAIRTIIVLIFAWVMVFVVGSQGTIASIPARSLVFLGLSGLATGASWLCYFYALQRGPIDKVVPIDKSSTVMTILLAALLLGDPLPGVGSAEQAAAQAARLTRVAPQVVVTGVTGIGGGRYIGCVGAARGGEGYAVKTPLQPRMFHGTGDIFAAVLVGRILRGNVPQAAVQAAAAFVAECIRQTPEGADERLGVWLENALPKLRQE